MKLPRFSIRELFGLILIIGLALGWWMDRERRRLEAEPHPIDRSWRRGAVEVWHEFEPDRYRYDIAAKWPDASPDLRIRGTLWMLSENVGEYRMTMVDAKPLDRKWLGSGTGTLSSYIPPIPRPTGFVFDYEIWNGEPDKGTLVAKYSVFSHPPPSRTQANGQTQEEE